MPRIDYRLKDGTKVPGVTTILSRWKDSGGLIHWAWQQGVDGKDYRESRDSAASAGTYAHQMVENFVHGFDEPPAPEGADASVLERAREGFQAWKNWYRNYALEIIETEVSLVSEDMHVGGTIDWIMRDDQGNLSIGDGKSGGFYRDHVIQVAAYRALWEENREGKITSVHVVRFDKDSGIFQHTYLPAHVLRLAENMFRAMRRLYDLDKELKKIVK